MYRPLPLMFPIHYSDIVIRWLPSLQHFKFRHRHILTVQYHNNNSIFDWMLWLLNSEKLVRFIVIHIILVHFVSCPLPFKKAKCKLMSTTNKVLHPEVTPSYDYFKMNYAKLGWCTDHSQEEDKFLKISLWLTHPLPWNGSHVIVE